MTTDGQHRVGIDPNAAWQTTVADARKARLSVEVIVEYAAPSPQAGRKLKLWYDPVTDKEGWTYLDQS